MLCWNYKLTHTKDKVHTRIKKIHHADYGVFLYMDIPMQCVGKQREVSNNKSFFITIILSSHFLPPQNSCCLYYVWCVCIPSHVRSRKQLGRKWEHFPLKPYSDVLRIGSLEVGCEFFSGRFHSTPPLPDSLVRCPESAWNLSTGHMLCIEKNMSHCPKKHL